ncbi:hypothetical protein [Microbispora sp. NBC_01389]|uniref:hypothetical protein n=1 Tax=Microbispora sp. NBC_01389 TaxID=2903584 RepID=UPI00324C8C9E
MGAPAAVAGAHDPGEPDPRPRDPERYPWEFWWGGRRALAYVEGGRLTLRAADGADLTAGHRWVRLPGKGNGAG